VIAIAAGEPLSRVPPARSTKALARGIEAARPRRCAPRFTRARCGSCRTRQNLSEQDAGNDPRTAGHFHRGLTIVEERSAGGAKAKTHWRTRRKRHPQEDQHSADAQRRDPGSSAVARPVKKAPDPRAAIATPCNDCGPEGECLRRATQCGFTSAWYQFFFCDNVSLARMSVHTSASQGQQS